MPSLPLVTCLHCGPLPDQLGVRSDGLVHQGPALSKASSSRIAKTSDMRSVTSSGVSQSTAVDSSDVRSEPPEGLQRKTRATMPRVVFSRAIARRGSRPPALGRGPGAAHHLGPPVGRRDPVGRADGQGSQVRGRRAHRGVPRFAHGRAGGASRGTTSGGSGCGPSPQPASGTSTSTICGTLATPSPRRAGPPRGS